MQRLPKIETDGTTRVDVAHPFGVGEPQCGRSQVQPIMVLAVPAAGAPAFRSSAPTTATAAQETCSLCCRDTRPVGLRRLRKDLGSFAVPQRRASPERNATGTDSGPPCGDDARLPRRALA
jgi:hypothetical protein